MHIRNSIVSPQHMRIYIDHITYTIASESLQYVLESVPIVDRAFVHVDYASYNIPTHLQQQAK